MKGKYHFELWSKRIRYKFDINRNITFIEGDSGTGKSTLVNLLMYAQEEGQFETGIHITANFKWSILTQRDWDNGYHLNISDNIVFIDEHVKFISSKEFASYVEMSGNYFVIISREPLTRHSNLPYSVNEIYRMKNSGKYNYLVPLYNIKDITKIPDCLITEDENTGNDFFNKVAKKYNLKCIAADGKSKIYNKVLSEINNDSKEILVVADGAAFGAEIYDINRLCKLHPNVHLWLPESFEYLILKSPMFRKNKHIQDILNNPYMFITTDFLSWERFFTKKLIEHTQGYPCHYSKKGKLNNCYIEDCCCRYQRYPMLISGDKIDNILGDKASIFKTSITNKMQSKKSELKTFHLKPPRF